MHTSELGNKGVACEIFSENLGSIHVGQFQPLPSQISMGPWRYWEGMKPKPDSVLFPHSPPPPPPGIFQIWLCFFLLHYLYLTLACFTSIQLYFLSTILYPCCLLSMELFYNHCRDVMPFKPQLKWYLFLKGLSVSLKQSKPPLPPFIYHISLT